MSGEAEFILIYALRAIAPCKHHCNKVKLIDIALIELCDVLYITVIHTHTHGYPSQYIKPSD